MLSDHAIIKIGGFNVPLLGIAPSAVQDICDGCGKVFNIQQLLVRADGAALLCPVCQRRYKHRKKRLALL